MTDSTTDSTAVPATAATTVPAAVPAEPMTFDLPNGDTVTVGPNRLTPKARALAEAIAETGLRRISVRSVAPAREVYGTRAGLFVAADALDKPITRAWENWAASDSPARHATDPYRWLEYEARKMIGWYPVAADGTDLPSSQAAREDDGVGADDALNFLNHACPAGTAPSKAAWMQYAIRGEHGYPAPVRHNGIMSLWSVTDLSKYASFLHVCHSIGVHRATAVTVEMEATAALKFALLAAVTGGMPETLAERVFGVARQTIRDWRAAAAAAGPAVPPADATAE